jgi:peptidoglycan hydrolase CwlO-like protein
MDSQPSSAPLNELRQKKSGVEQSIEALQRQASNIQEEIERKTREQVQIEQ